MYGNQAIKDLISRDKFWLILKVLHWNVDKVLEILNSQFQKYWKLGCCVAIDEGLIRFKGRYQYRQHLPNKPAGTGIKLYGLADKLGFLYSLWIYQGPYHGEETKPHNIVINFSKLLTESNVIYVDCYYGSLLLAQELDKNNLKFVLCCKSDRPSVLFSKKLHCQLKKGSWNYGLWEDKLLAISFWDSAKCNFISNCFSVSNTEKPSLIEKYNIYKGGLDTADAYWNKYLVGFRHYKWTRAVVFALIKIALVNSYLIYKSLNPEEEKKVSQRHFMEKIILTHIKNIKK